MLWFLLLCAGARSQQILISFDSASNRLANSGSWGAAFDAVADNAFGWTTSDGFRQSGSSGGSAIRIKGVKAALLANNQFGISKSLTLSWWMRNFTFEQNVAVMSTAATGGGWLVGSSNAFDSYTFCVNWGVYRAAGARPDGADCLQNWRPWPMSSNRFAADDSWFHTAVDFDAVASTTRLFVNGLTFTRATFRGAARRFS
jgi:hypothetical protein